MAGKSTGEAWKQRHVFRLGTAIFVFRVAIWKVHANAQNTADIRHHHLKGEIRVGYGLSFGSLGQLAKRPSGDNLVEAFELGKFAV